MCLIHAPDYEQFVELLKSCASGRERFLRIRVNVLPYASVYMKRCSRYVLFASFRLFVRQNTEQYIAWDAPIYLYMSPINFVSVVLELYDLQNRCDVRRSLEIRDIFRPHSWETLAAPDGRKSEPSYGIGLRYLQATPGFSLLRFLSYTLYTIRLKTNAHIHACTPQHNKLDSYINKIVVKYVKIWHCYKLRLRPAIKSV